MITLYLNGRIEVKRFKNLYTSIIADMPMYADLFIGGILMMACDDLKLHIQSETKG